MDQLHAQQDLEPHPFSEILPLIEGEDFDALVKSIQDNGLVEPIVLFEGRILDGRNRFRAIKAAGLALYEDEVKQWNGTAMEALDFVEAKNLARRQLTPAQRAMAAAKLATLRRGNSTHTRGEAELTTEEAATRLNVSPFLVKQARKVRADAEPNIIRMVERGEITMNMGNRAADLPREQQAGFADGDAVRAHFSPPVDGRAKPAPGPRKITANHVNRTLSALADLAEAPPREVVSVLADLDRSALAQLLPTYQAFLESLRQAITEIEECRAAG